MGTCGDERSTDSPGSRWWRSPRGCQGLSGPRRAAGAGLQLGHLSVPARWSESNVSPSCFSFPQNSAFCYTLFVVRKTKAISTIWEKKHLWSFSVF